MLALGSTGAAGGELSARLTKIDTAIQRRKRIEFEYFTMQSGETALRKVDPYLLLFEKGEFYLVGHAHERGKVRMFRLSRIRGKVAYATKAEHDFQRPEDFDREGLRSALMLQYMVGPEAVLDPAGTPDLEAVVRAVQAEGEAAFQRKVDYLREFGRKLNLPDVDGQILSQVMLSVLDEKWKDHLYDLDQLRNAIQYRAYGQKDPLVEYKREAFEMFEDLMRDIQASFTERFLKVQVSAEPPRRPPPPPPPAPAAGKGTEDLFTAPARPSPGAPPAGVSRHARSQGPSSPRAPSAMPANTARDAAMPSATPCSRRTLSSSRCKRRTK